MGDTEIESAYEALREDIAFAAGIAGDSPRAAFFHIYAGLAAENGDTIDLAHAPARRDGRGGYKIDGYAFDAERAVLYLAIADFRTGLELETLNGAQIDALLQQVRRFVDLATSGAFIEDFDPGSPEFEAGYQLSCQPASVRRIRVIVFSNARLSTRRPPEPAPEIGGRPVVYNFLDFTRYAQILRSRSSPEPIEVDLIALQGGPVRCLPAFSGGDGYEAYLLALPGALLADIYGLYGARLLEQNVRTFLQAKTKVNKGILETIKDAPEMFFAYNNGLTATASGIQTEVLADGTTAIARIDDLQIVNGGQTTASILYARDRTASDLDNVFVQMKLSVVKAELIEEIVPKISRFANSQNKVSEADFFASHRFHITMEKISRRLMAPPRPGAFGGSKWFYERARGQYRDAKAYGTAAQRRAFEVEYPPDQMIDKTQLAKFETTFACLPYLVCQGAQKCFLLFAERIAAEWHACELSFNDDWYKSAAAKAVLFRWTDQMVGQATWYREDRGYKSQTVAYSLSWLVSRARKAGKAGLNLSLIWNAQEIPEEFRIALQQLAPQVAAAIKQTPDTIRNVGEFCKKQACWNIIDRTDFDVVELPEAFLLDKEQAREASKEARSVRQIDKGIELEAMILQLMPHAARLEHEAKRLLLLSPSSRGALAKLASGRFSFPPSDLRALADLLTRMAERGFDPMSLLNRSNIEDPERSATIKLSSSAVKTVRI